ncbi:uncharacterized protein LOC110769577 [Prunus avium]|uniref:Uncharacterized protein LOC110769577 n=1 Tax=Prunus avium TaxID=42229 RepID=A0A6P5TQ58_PRUAV|nr:uncharacterized protein LOC110769577 [Prunus avium]
MFNNGGYSSNRGSHFKGRGRGRGSYQSGPRPYQVQPTSSPGILGPGTDIPTCQICSKKGHVAVDCYQRHNQPSTHTSSVQCQICWKFGHSAIQCYHRGNFSYQGKPPSTNLSARHANFPSSTPHEQFWVADTSSTTHMTSDLAQLSLATILSQDLILLPLQGVQDKITGNVLLKGLCRAGLYPIPFSISSIPPPRLPQASSFPKNQFCYLGQQVKTSL